MKQNNSNLKRGLLELDLILQSFYVDTYKKLDNDSKINFNKLLQMDDIKLLKLIFNPESSFDNELKYLLKLIKNHPNNLMKRGTNFD